MHVAPVSLAILPLALAVVASAAGCKKGPPCGPSDDNRVVACLDNTAVTRAEVEPYIRQQFPVPGSSVLPDPRNVALEEALRVRLFAVEARRRHLQAQERASVQRRRAILHQKLTAHVVKTQKLGIADISVDDAHRFYGEHPGEVNKVEHVECRAIYVRDADAAESLYKRVAGQSEAVFSAVAKDASIGASSVAGGDIGAIAHDGPRVDIDLLRLSMTLRKRGAVGGPVKLADGRYVILFAKSVHMTVAAFEGSMIRKTKNVMARQRKMLALDALYSRLRAGSRVEVFAQAVAALPLPKARAPMKPQATDKASTQP